jgi:hypothetical protein
MAAAVCNVCGVKLTIRTSRFYKGQDLCRDCLKSIEAEETRSAARQASELSRRAQEAVAEPVKAERICTKCNAFIEDAAAHKQERGPGHFVITYQPPILAFFAGTSAALTAFGAGAFIIYFLRGFGKWCFTSAWCLTLWRSVLLSTS